MSKLSAHDVVGNCRTAFDAAESLGIPRVIEPRDMSLLAVPDKLAVMTYLHQLRAHFTGRELHIEQIGNFIHFKNIFKTFPEFQNFNISQVPRPMNPAMLLAIINLIIILKIYPILVI